MTGTFNKCELSDPVGLVTTHPNYHVQEKLDLVDLTTSPPNACYFGVF